MFEVNSAYRPLMDDAPETHRRICLFIGGRGSGKSRAIAQYLAMKAARSRCRIALVRKVRDNIRDSSWKELRDAISGQEVERMFTFRSNPLGVVLSNGSEFVCKGLDDAEKVKSLAEVDEVWIEEATEITEEDFTTLNLGLRGAGRKRLILTCNPIKSWVKSYFFLEDGRTLRDPGEVFSLHTTYVDNRFRGEAFDQAMERLRERDPLRFQRDGQGLWVDMQGLVYPEFEVVDAWPEACTAWTYGTDFGFNDPTCVVRVAMHEGAMYVDEVLYETGLDSDRIHARFQSRMAEHGRRPNYCDNARPEMIAYLHARGWNVHPCTKGKNSVQDGIAYVRGQQLRITRRSTNLLREIEGYRWITDKAGKAIDEPVDYDNHAMDAMRYAAVDGYGKRTSARTEYVSVRKRNASGPGRGAF